jgi:hypothetical protein
MVVGRVSSLIDMGDELRTMVASTLVTHPFLKSNPGGAIRIAEDAVRKQEHIQYIRPIFPPNGAGIFETHLGQSADEVLDTLTKSCIDGVDDEIMQLKKSVEVLKDAEIQATLDSLIWADDYQHTIRDLGLSERTLKSLRLFGESRKISLIRSCQQWESAGIALKMLDEFEDVWGDEERGAWEHAMIKKQGAREMWHNALHQFDTLSKMQQNWLIDTADILKAEGPLNARGITERLTRKGAKRLEVNQLSKLLKMYGEEIAIIKGHRQGEYMIMDNDGLVIKDVWPYAAGFMDHSGSLTITERDEPRAIFVSKGFEGRRHCEDLHKHLGFGSLQLDNIIKSEITEHRVIFYGYDEVTKLLAGMLPHLEDKQTIAKAMGIFVTSNSKKEASYMREIVQSYEGES